MVLHEGTAVCDDLCLISGVEVLPGSLSPSFLFFWALLFTAGADGELSAPLSLQGVSCALQSGALQLLSYAVTHKKSVSCQFHHFPCFSFFTLSLLSG